MVPVLFLGTCKAGTQLLVTLLLVCASWSHCQINRTATSEVQALLELKAAFLLEPNDSFLSSWEPGTDPCATGWEGVFCTCSVLNATSKWTDYLNCTKEYNANDELRVLQLSLPYASLTGSISSHISELSELLHLDLSSLSSKTDTAEEITQDAWVPGVSPPQLGLSGTLPEELSLLQQLQVLDVANNRLSGTIPAALADLPNLRALVLTSNNFSGSVPAALSPKSERNLTVVHLDGNNLSGALPEDWCSAVGNIAAIDYKISNNIGLCGRVPPNCGLDPSPFSILGTSLFWTRAQLLSGTGGTCDSSPPNCTSALSPEALCQVFVEPFWTSSRRVTFNSTELQDAESELLSYTWSLGTLPGLADVLGPLAVNLTSEVISNTSVPRVYRTVHSLPAGLSLMDGQTYYTTVSVKNSAAPPLWTNITSAAVLVDTTPPEVAWVHIPRDATETSNLTSLYVSWEAADTAAGSGLSYIIVQLLDLSTPPPYGEVASERVEGGVNELTLNKTLVDQHSYLWVVTAVDHAGLQSSRNSSRLLVNVLKPVQVGTNTFAITIVLTAIGALLVGSVVALLVMRGRIKQQQQRDKDKQRELKQMKALMYALTNAHASVTSPKLKGEEDLQNCKDFAFVVTDVENSTEQSTTNPVAFSAMQDIHDQVMREGIARYNGYEIITEGDSFSIAFVKISDAVQFCLETQYRLLETNWPRAVLKLPSCKPVFSADGELIFKGPRIRMGVHWATEGTVAHRLHNLTRQRIFQGPGWVLAQEIGELAYGGQVVLSHEGWLALRENMPDAGFPVVHQIGRYVMQCSPQNPMWMYNITEVIGRPLPRKFDPPLRKSQKLAAGLGLHIMPPPQPRNGRMLTFAALRLTTFPANRSQLPVSVANKLEEVIAMQAQQFKGYMYYLHKADGRFYLAFEQVMDAMRFCHATQMLLMYTKWPEEAEDFSGQAVPNPDGRWIFKGPRVAMAVHESDDYEAMRLSVDRHACHEDAMEFSGTAHQQASMLAQVIRGGQVVLSERAWDSIKAFLGQHPGAAQVCSLGTHIVDTFTQQVLLQEVMPNMLARRNFKPPTTRRMLEPGYREAPSSTEAMAIVFVKVQKPMEVVMAERQDENMREEQVLQVITDYQVAVQQYTNVARKLLRIFDGYECKEPEPGKFTLVFRQLSNAVRWSVAVQVALLKIDWSQGLLQMQDCQRQTDVGNRLIWAGLRVRMGMAYGFATNKKPLNTGRADYFGVLPNTAARVMAQAAPGQVLVEATGALGSDLGMSMREDQATWISDGLNSKEDLMTGHLMNVMTAIELKPLGYFSLKGIEDSKLIFQATHASLLSRQFPVSPELVREPQGSASVRRLSGTKRSGSSKWAIMEWLSHSKPSWVLRRSVSKSFVSKTSPNHSQLPLYIRSSAPSSTKSSQILQSQLDHQPALSVPNIGEQLRPQQMGSSFVQLEMQSAASVSHRTASMPIPHQAGLLPVATLPSLDRENAVRFECLVDEARSASPAPLPLINTAASMDSASECASPSSSASPLGSPMTPPGKALHLHHWMFARNHRDFSFSSALTSGSGNSTSRAASGRKDPQKERQTKKWHAKKLKHLKILRNSAGVSHKRASSFASISSPADTPRSVNRTMADPAGGSMSSSPSPRHLAGGVDLSSVFASQVAQAYVNHSRRLGVANQASGAPPAEPAERRTSNLAIPSRVGTASTAAVAASFPPRAMSMSHAQISTGSTSYPRPPTVERTRSMDRGPSRQSSHLSMSEQVMARRMSLSDPEMGAESPQPMTLRKPKPLNLSMLPDNCTPEGDGVVQVTDGSLSEGSASYSPRTALQAQRLGVPHSHMTHIPSPLRPVGLAPVRTKPVVTVPPSPKQPEASKQTVVSRLKNTFSWGSKKSDS